MSSSLGDYFAVEQQANFIRSFVYGGATNAKYDTSFPRNENYTSVFVLSLPAFRWFRSTERSPSRRAHHTCAVGANSQMIVVGGFDPSSPLEAGRVPDPWDNGLGVFDMNSLQWSDIFNASASNYSQPTPIKSYYERELVIITIHMLIVQR